ncbi:Uma2 family endonuclease [Nocardia sp. CDC159]|uniref:Uma2 family endonuclease n=1 Tax=Nocardia pulmonis TaxID=2951408 RepID=A0A9X2EAZ2_9NOCA|nr:MULTISPECIES: Uma2 family endonuclease [Nocardia]MCM6777392.1 Uma2 family endonuclease [Nocardia pulmonis]MCM6790277.1 Uma2 family endonuclease [Nocardia sp. CDC159]
MAFPAQRLLTIADFAALEEDERGRWELVEGNLMVAPSPTPQHSNAAGELYMQLRPQLPQGVKLLLDVDLDLQLAPDGGAGHGAQARSVRCREVRV